MSTSEVDDDALVVRAVEGDVGAFEGLVRRHQRPIYALCLRMLDGATEAAEDAVQAVFLTAWRRLPERPGDVAVAVWLHRIAVRRCLRVLRRERATGAGDPSALSRCVGRLPPRQRACWLLREVQGLSGAEIAYVLDLPEESVRANIVRARVRLAAEIVPRP